MTWAVRVAREAGVPVVADFERGEMPGFNDLLALVDHLIVSWEFAAWATSAGAPGEAAARLWNAGRRAVVVTCGAEGAWYVADGAPARHHDGQEDVRQDRRDDQDAGNCLQDLGYRHVRRRP